MLMKQLLQSLADGKTMIEEVYTDVSKGQYLIKQNQDWFLNRAHVSRIWQSEFTKQGRQQPDKVKEVIAMAKTDGLLSTFDAVKAKLDQPIPLGIAT